MNDFLPESEHAILNAIEALAAQTQTEVWVVGGVVRDALLQVPKRLADIDLVVAGDASAMAKLVAAHFHGSSRSFSDFLTAKVSGLPGINELDFASSRSETYPQPGALPRVTPANLEQDCWRRDFSVNALYVKLKDFLSGPATSWRDKVFDPVMGLPDLDGLLIRVLHDASFLDDPTRLFRAQRYKLKINAQLEARTESLFSEALSTNALASISSQRILMEIKKSCSEPQWPRLLAEFCKFSLLSRSSLVESADQEMPFAERLLAAPQELSPGLRFDYFLGLLYSITAADKREPFFRKLGFGKKFFKHMQVLLDPTVECANDPLAFALRTSVSKDN